MASVMPERTHWRDEQISLRHRLWGVSCPATDLDFVLLEYSCSYGIALPAAIIEYKNEHARQFNTSSPQYQAISYMCTCAKIPFFVVRYTSDFKKFLVEPINNFALQKFNKSILISELTYVRFLYWLRGLSSVPEKILDVLKE